MKATIPPSHSPYTVPGIVDRYVSDDPEKILKMVADYYDLTLDQIRHKTRLKNIVIPRQVAMFLYKKHTRLSLAEIGRICGNKDHASVLHSVKSVNNMIDTNFETVRLDVAKLELKLK
ncbi:MAG: helix-turn-helix domain-containing protein [Bacteroidales bacterium]